ncbi:S41 family peptidase [Flavimarina sp. Hel_I_48]|uniref:S41 family peptidase n=1 Tax=Flavimarina sp. Hel_I_48 TaxID=1392488 RepID=UPI0004DEFE61|nr:S41 family peptidase [Flavimarina sp. Hel_I_48]
MKKLPQLLVMCFFIALTTSCSKDRDDEIQPVAESLEVENFIYSAMNIWYLYKPNVPALADDRFANQEELDAYLNGFETPELLFYEGVKAPEPLDRFSIITPDYRELERSFAGVSLNNGMDFGLGRISDGSNQLVGFVRYVLPNTSAEAQGVERGMLFTQIDGNPLTLDNYRELLAQTSYEITVADINSNNEITETGQTISLTKEEYTENPIFIIKTFDNIGGQKVGYLMYNSFTANFDEELNNTFADLKASGINELILDLRYNSGGSVRSATDLAAMITGQFAGEVFSTEVFNPQLQAIFEAGPDAEDLNNRFNTEISGGTAINSLNLSKLYVLTTGSSASASELVINGLDPYIDVVQIGETTTGKFQASTTFYDNEAPRFSRNGANPNHFYAIQPLIFTSANVNGVTGFVDGLVPEVLVEERVSTYGVLGDENEPLLRTALDQIRGGRSFDLKQAQGLILPLVGESGMESPTYQRMYVDTPKLNK